MGRPAGTSGAHVTVITTILYPGPGHAPSQIDDRFLTIACGPRHITRPGDESGDRGVVSFSDVVEQQFEVFLDEHGACVVRGELDEFTGVEVDACLNAHPDVSCIDLGEVSFVDSAGLRFLLLARQRLAADGTTFVVRRSSGAVRRLMRLAGVSDLFAPTAEQGTPAAG
jgi:anti-anti-sigma factor